MSYRIWEKEKGGEERRQGKRKNGRREEKIKIKKRRRKMGKTQIQGFPTWKERPWEGATECGWKCLRAHSPSKRNERNLHEHALLPNVHRCFGTRSFLNDMNQRQPRYYLLLLCCPYSAVDFWSPGLWFFFSSHFLVLKSYPREGSQQIVSRWINEWTN